MVWRRKGPLNMDRVLGKIDKDLASFIDQYVDSFVNWDLVTFFGYNPEASGTSSDIAGRLGRNEKDVDEALEALVRKGLCEKVKDAGRTIYRCAPAPELKERMAVFVKCLEDRAKRLQILAYLLRAQSGHGGQ